MTQRIAVTGPTGFIGIHTVLRLSREEDVEVVPLTREDFAARDRLPTTLAHVDAVIHLAGQNRVQESELLATNVGVTRQLIQALPHDARTRVVFASSTQRNLDNPYGRSKREAEALLAEAPNVEEVLAEIPNVFGPGSRPFYNSVVATFCHELTHGGQPIVDRDKQLELVWINDLAEILVKLSIADSVSQHVRPSPTYGIRVAALLNELTRLRDIHFGERQVPDLPTDLSGHLYRTLVTYAPYDAHAYQPTLLSDDRGYLFECVKQRAGGGQIFFSTTKPGVTRGNHYHTRKYEKFCVLSGEGTIRLRWLGSNETVEYKVAGDNPTLVDIPLFHSHSIENSGSTDMLTLFWSNELFDPDDSDTFRALAAL